MPTEPNRWLNRDLADQGADKLVPLACPALREAINRATHVFEECQRSSSDVPDQDLPVMMTFLHLLEMADGVEILLSSGSAHPTKLLLRSMFEATLTIGYILKNNTKERSFAWLACRAHRHLSAYEVMSPKTQAGVVFRDESKNDESNVDLELLPQAQLDEAIDNIRQMLKLENYSAAEAEFRRLSKKRKPEWHSFYGGPTTIRELAKEMQQLSAYQFLHKTWSDLTHAGDGGRWLTTTAKGQPAFHALRNPADLLQAAHLAISFLLTGMMTMVAKYSPSNDLKRWYLADLQKQYMSLTEIKINIVPRQLSDDQAM